MNSAMPDAHFGLYRGLERILHGGMIGSQSHTSPPNTMRVLRPSLIRLAMRLSSLLSERVELQVHGRVTAIPHAPHHDPVSSFLTFASWNIAPFLLLVSASAAFLAKLLQR